VYVVHCIVIEAHEEFLQPVQNLSYRNRKHTWPSTQSMPHSI